MLKENGPAVGEEGKQGPGVHCMADSKPRGQGKEQIGRRTPGREQSQPRPGGHRALQACALGRCPKQDAVALLQQAIPGQQGCAHSGREGLGVKEV